MPKRINLVGKKINMLTVIEQMPYSGGRSKFKCVCECGVEKIVDGPKLNSGRLKSCGCYRQSKEHKENMSKARRLKWGESLENLLIGSYKRNAKIKGYEFELTDEQIKKLFKGTCFYCGREPYNTISKKNHYGNYTYNGIDRKINTVGYIMDNVVSCCSQCNFLKNSYNIDDFINLIRMINENIKNYNI